MLTQNLPEFWETMYKAKKDVWDLGKANPSLLEFFKNPLCPKKGRVLVPGAGRGWMIYIKWRILPGGKSRSVRRTKKSLFLF